MNRDIVKKIQSVIVIIWGILFGCGLKAGEPVFHFKIINLSFFARELKLECSANNVLVGFLYTLQIPLSLGVIHSFFIYPPFRNKGYGRKLLQFAIHNFKKAGFEFIFIQPGPFDYKEGEFKNIPPGLEREIKLKKLISFYKSVGFKNAHRFIAKLTKLIYYVAQINENPKYLMVG